MICLNCKKQIPDDSTKCPHCGTEVFHKHQLKKEIGMRRWQRWFFYIIIILMFAGMIGIIVKIYDTNTKLMVEKADIQKGLIEKDVELDAAKIRAQELEDLRTDLETEKEKLTGNLSDTEEELAIKIEEIEKEIDSKTWDQETLSGIREALKTMVSTIGLTIPQADLDKIALASVDLPGNDSDSDGLIDKLEEILGTDINKADTDDDGYDDKNEILRGYNPKGEGSLNIDPAISELYKGKIVTSEGDTGQTWYIGEDGKKYFLEVINY